MRATCQPDPRGKPVQILVDTVTDSPADMRAAAHMLNNAANLRDQPKPADYTPSTASPETRQQVANLERVLDKALDRAAAQLVPAGTFGKSPLPADAIAIDMPENFTAPAAAPAVTSAASSPDSAQSAAPAPTTTPNNASPATTTAGDGSSPDTTPRAPAKMGGDWDKDGYPWDARIHSESRALNKDNTWRIKRGVDKALLESVRNELRPPLPNVPAGTTIAGATENPVVDAQVNAAMLANSTPVVPPPPPAVPAADVVSGIATPMPPPPPPAASVSAPGQLPPGYQVGVTVTTFQELMAYKATPAMQAGIVKSTDLMDICKGLGLDGLQQLVPTHKAIPDVAAAIDKRMGLTA